MTTCRIDGKKVMVAADRTKSKSSMRTMPLGAASSKSGCSIFKTSRISRGNCAAGSYCRDFLGYICVDEMGVLIKPDYISAAFPKLLDRHGLAAHTLPRPCATAAPVCCSPTASR